MFDLNKTAAIVIWFNPKETDIQNIKTYNSHFQKIFIVDNSDTVEHINNGVMFRNTLTFYVDDARLYMNNPQVQGKIECGVESFNRRKPQK